MDWMNERLTLKVVATNKPGNQYLSTMLMQYGRLSAGTTGGLDGVHVPILHLSVDGKSYFVDIDETIRHYRVIMTVTKHQTC